MPVAGRALSSSLTRPLNKPRGVAGNLDSGTVPVPAGEERRLEKLHSLGVLGRVLPQVDPLVKEAARIFDAPISAVSLVDTDRQVNGQSQFCPAYLVAERKVAPCSGSSARLASTVNRPGVPRPSVPTPSWKMLRCRW